MNIRNDKIKNTYIIAIFSSSSETASFFIDVQDAILSVRTMFQHLIHFQLSFGIERLMLHSMRAFVSTEVLTYQDIEFVQRETNIIILNENCFRTVHHQILLAKQFVNSRHSVLLCSIHVHFVLFENKRFASKFDSFQIMINKHKLFKQLIEAN